MLIVSLNQFGAEISTSLTSPTRTTLGKNLFITSEDGRKSEIDQGCNEHARYDG